MEQIMSDFKFKKDKIKQPQIKSLNGQKMWTMTSVDYMKTMMQNLKECIIKKDMEYRKHVTTHTCMVKSYTPEVDASEELLGGDITMFQEFIRDLWFGIVLYT